jgi:aquaporin Z
MTAFFSTGFDEWLHIFAGEAWGTCLFTLLGSLAASGDLPALANGLLLTTCVYASSALSPGHLNPAVSWAAYLSGRIKRQELFICVAGQTAGSLLGGALVLPLFPHPWSCLADGRATLPSLCIESVCTSLLIVSVLVRSIPNDVRPLVVGLTLTSGILSGGYSLNPLRTLWPSVFVSRCAPAMHAIIKQAVAPLVGGTIVGLVGRVMVRHPDESVIRLFCWS